MNFVIQHMNDMKLHIVFDKNLLYDVEVVKIIQRKGEFL
jgi:hypothetical protein